MQEGIKLVSQKPMRAEGDPKVFERKVTL